MAKEGFLDTAFINDGKLKIHRPSADQFSLIVFGTCVEGTAEGQEVMATFEVFDRQSPRLFGLIQALLVRNHDSEILDSVSYDVYSDVAVRVERGRLVDVKPAA